MEQLGVTHPAHTEVACAYLARVVSNGGAVLTDYVPKAVDDLGRQYCIQVGAQRLSRVFRLALFGATHVELDLCGSFIELTRRIMSKLDPTGPCLPPVSTLRAIIAQCFSQDHLVLFPDLPKHVPLRVMNSSVDATLQWLSSQGLPLLHGQALRLVTLLHRQTHSVVLHLMPRLRPNFSTDTKDAPFRTLEVIENKLMRAVLRGLHDRGLVQSAIWLHDGLWLSPPPPTEVIGVIEANAVRDLGLAEHESFLRVETLKDKLRHLKASVEHVSVEGCTRFRFLRQPSAQRNPQYTAMFGRLYPPHNSEGVRKYRQRRASRVSSSSLGVRSMQMLCRR